MKSLYETIVNEGVKFENGEFVFDFDKNFSSDIINFRNLVSYKTNIRGDVYFYGYEFRKNVDRKIRTKFIDGLKQLSWKLPDVQRTQFIRKVVSMFLSTTRLGSVNCLIYPTSLRTNINHDIVTEIGHGLRVNSYSTFELVKNLSSNISFDFDRFTEDFYNKPLANGRQRYTETQWKERIESIHKLIDKIHKLDYFSIAKEVKDVKLRPYIKDYLLFKNETDKQTFIKISNPHILIVDDINTSFSTIEEIIKLIRSFNPNSDITVFTLIGKKL